MKRWKDILISPDVTILQAIKMIDAGSLQIVLVVNDNGCLLGTVSDGDVRRGILKGVQLTESVQRIMCSTPTVAKANQDRETILALMKSRQLRQIPIVDEAHHVVGLELWDELIEINQRENWVVLMAGGLGSRLGSLTQNCPKPLLRVGDKPILETIIDSCREYGFYKFFIAVNYKADMVKQYFGDGSRFGVEIKYIHESKRLGTAGALSLIPDRQQLPLLVMNADVLTKVNLQQLMTFHEEYGADATMCVREYDFQVPYGVVNIDHHRLLGVEEKPVQRFFVNAGIYLLGPASLNLIPDNQYFDMTTLFESLIEANMPAAAFPIREYWLDVGQLDDFERANGEYHEVFK